SNPWPSAPTARRWPPLRRTESCASGTWLRARKRPPSPGRVRAAPRSPSAGTGTPWLPETLTDRGDCGTCPSPAVRSRVRQERGAVPAPAFLANAATDLRFPKTCHANTALLVDFAWQAGHRGNTTEETIEPWPPNFFPVVERKSHHEMALPAGRR